MPALLEREEKVDSWNDERLDELSRRMDAGFAEMREGFAKIDREMKEGFARVDRRFEKVDERFERIDERFERIDERFERLDDRFFKLMVVMLVIAGGMLSAAIGAQI
jgi:archaellum component FlaC